MTTLQSHYGCATEFSLELIGGKWKPLILAWLKEEPHRYRDLKRRIPRVSDKMLTQCLREMEAAGLIEQHGEGGGYRLAERGERLRPALEALHRWGEDLAGELSVDVGRAIR